MTKPTDRAVAPRLLVVFDGEAWFVRRVRVIEHDLDRDEKVYRCDAHMGGPFATLDEAVQALAALKEMP